MNYYIREANLNDFKQINDLYIQMIKYVNEENKKCGVQVNENLFSAGYEDGYLDSFIDNEDKFIYVACDMNDNVIGFLSCVYNIGYEEYLYLDDFCVNNNMRGNGIGTALIEKVFSKLNDKDIVRLHVDKNNYKAKNYYEELGFVIKEDCDNRFLMERESKRKTI